MKRVGFSSFRAWVIGFPAVSTAADPMSAQARSPNASASPSVLTCAHANALNALFQASIGCRNHSGKRERAKW